MSSIKSILIANRGEIAVRIIKTARNMGIKTYAFQTPQEANAVYLNWADEVIRIREESSARSVFLSPELIVGYAKEYGIEAIHPGYGFLAESPALPELCDREGVLFIGPSADIIRKMGDKNEARQLAVRLGVPVVKGSNVPVNTLEEAKFQIKKIGYPVMLKALAGGGGKGMRVVTKAAELEPAFRMAVGEATNAFNSGAMLIEKYVGRPRHIEIQILADKHGNAVHLFERECSIQRNHQKLLEEAPSPGLTDKLRDKMARDALELAQATGYFTLGTVEFLLDQKKNYYFMEMNTRIQVEHPVTEAITGLDLVEWQIRTAAGEKMTLKQEEIKKHGWAMEFRINAEDVQAGFAPNFGIIDEMNFPGYPGLRVDSGFIPGSVIPGIYDSLIAKLIVSGKNRASVIEKSIGVMQHSNIEGIKTTIPFFKAVLHHPAFVAGNMTTSFVSEMKELFYQEENEEEAAAMIALQTYLNDMEPIEKRKVGSEAATPWISRMWNKLF